MKWAVLNNGPGILAMPQSLRPMGRLLWLVVAIVAGWAVIAGPLYALCLIPGALPLHGWLGGTFLIACLVELFLWEVVVMALLIGFFRSSIVAAIIGLPASYLLFAILDGLVVFRAGVLFGMLTGPIATVCALWARHSHAKRASSALVDGLPPSDAVAE